MNFILTSEAFADGQFIPAAYTCDGSNISPPLGWTSVPDGSQCLALLVEDPDAPGGIFTHWVLYDIPLQAQRLAGALPRQPLMPDGSRQGVNSFGHTGYDGPCPPAGVHHYVCTLFAVDRLLALPVGTHKVALLQALQGHVRGQAKLTGLYSRGAG